jgi:RNA polymerase sigma-70 factor (ECF subfamily)
MLQDFPSASIEAPREHHKTPGDLNMLVAHLDPAYNLARCLMRNDTEAQDVVQQAYLKAIRHFAGFRGGDRRAWLLTIVRNECSDRMRRKGASSGNTEFNEAVHSGGKQIPDPETAFLLAERTELLKRSLEELPFEHREVLVLRDLEQMSYWEIANVTGIPVGTVMSRLNRARQQLRRIFLANTRPTRTVVRPPVPGVRIERRDLVHC